MRKSERQIERAEGLIQINCFLSLNLCLSLRVSLVSGLGRGTFRDPNSGTWCRSLFSLVSYLQEIYFFDAILPGFGIHQVEYLSKDQKGERKRKEKVLRHKDGEKKKKVKKMLLVQGSRARRRGYVKLKPRTPKLLPQHIYTPPASSIPVFIYSPVFMGLENCQEDGSSFLVHPVFIMFL